MTGAGRGIGREHALLLAAQGAKVVVNDNGAETDGTGGDPSRAQKTVDDIVAAGGQAIANSDSASSWTGAQRMVNTAIEHFGGLDIVVNNAGILRDRMLTNMTEEEWDAVIDVHLKGTFAPSRWAAAYWRDRSKAGLPVDGRIISTSSISGLYGNAGQSNYGAAKAGIAAFTIIAGMELARYGVTANAIAPIALTRMTENLGPELSEQQKFLRDPAWVSPVVCWLASPLSKHVTGRVFEAAGSILGIAQGWTRGPYVEPAFELRTDPAAIGPIVDRLLAHATPNTAGIAIPTEYPALD